MQYHSLFITVSTGLANYCLVHDSQCFAYVYQMISDSRCPFNRTKTVLERLFITYTLIHLSTSDYIYLYKVCTFHSLIQECKLFVFSVERETLLNRVLCKQGEISHSILNHISLLH